MSKDIIKKHLIVLKEEAKTPGIDKTKKIRDESGKTNKAANKAVAKEMEDLVKPLDSKDVSEPVKNEYTSEEEDYHNEMEIRNGNEMIEYGNKPNEIFQERAEEAISGSARMGNSPDYANVVTADQAGFTGPKFGENLVKTIKASKKKRDDAETVRGPKTTVSGADIKDSSMSNKGSKSIALSENKSIKENKKSKMKRLVFKKEFKGIENALKVIPESYKVNGKEFHMTDGNEKYEIKWEGSLTEGRAVILKASDKNLMTEDMAKMKHLMGYSSKETLGTVKGSARLDENARFNDILGKTKNLMTEMTGGYGFTGEGNLEGDLGCTDESIVYSTDDKKGSEEAMSRRAVTPKYHGIVINDQGEPGGHVEVMYAPYTHNDVKYIDYDEFIEKYPGALEYYQANGNKTPEGRDIMDAFDEESLGLSGVHDMYEDFPDLNKDGDITQADILMGRGVELDEGDINENDKINTIHSFLKNNGLEVEAVKSGNEGHDKAGEEGKVFIWNGGEGDMNYKKNGKEAFYVYTPWNEGIKKEIESKFPVIEVGGKSGNYYELVIEK